MEGINNITEAETTVNETVFKPENTCYKTWHYREKNKKHTVEHTISVSKDRFTHRADMVESKVSIKQKTDINLRNVHSVNACYGSQRNIPLAILLALLALASLVLSIYLFSDDEGTLGVVAIVAAITLGICAFIVFKTVKSAFYLEINTVGAVTNSTLAYGNSTGSGKTGANHKASTPKMFVGFAAIAALAYYLIQNGDNLSYMIRHREPGLIIPVVAIGIIIWAFSNKSNKAANSASSSETTSGYKFEMDPETGNEIIETIGALIIDR